MEFHQAVGYEKACRLSDTAHSEIASSLTLPSLPVCFGSADQKLELFDEPLGAPATHRPEVLTHAMFSFKVFLIVVEYSGSLQEQSCHNQVLEQKPFEQNLLNTVQVQRIWDHASCPRGEDPKLRGADLGSGNLARCSALGLSNKLIWKLEQFYLTNLLFQGYALLALHAHLPSLHPSDCEINGKHNNCEQVHGFNSAMLYIALYTTALGEGCVRGALPSFGGDQFDDKDPVELQLKASLFNWFTFGISLGGFIGLTLKVWIENNRGWDIGFGVSALAVLLGVLVVASGISFYHIQIPKESPLTLNSAERKSGFLRLLCVTMIQAVPVDWTRWGWLLCTADLLKLHLLLNRLQIGLWEVF
ncbi:hypothetical protein COCNU_07G000070 [Cocos nucifera]|uniref:Uncharacterized protein n=1 Tax=Cocos nucifera TaxID=13894 RepID=A0A8K0IDG2_COCNU|nr:hypothetical protein COCNU_07G000070 [Cocos nucifera]